MVVILSSFLSFYFAVLFVMEAGSGNYFNSFVLATISATYLKGALKGRISYPLVASLIASVFALLMLLSYLASGNFSYGLFSFASAPVYLYLRSKL